MPHTRGMATVTSASTRQQVLDAIADNASYVEDASSAKCKAFITAIRLFLHRWAFQKSREGMSEIWYDPKVMRDDLAIAEQWLATNGSTSGQAGGVKFYSVSGFRD